MQSFEGDLLTAKLVFLHHALVSPKLNLDLLVLHVKPGRGLSLLISLDGQVLNQNNRTISKEIGKQMPNTPFSHGFETYTETAKDAGMVSLAVSFLLNLVLGSALRMFLTMANALQLGMHLPFFGVIFPINVMTYLHTMMPLVEYDILENAAWYEDLFIPSPEEPGRRLAESVPPPPYNLRR